MRLLFDNNISPRVPRAINALISGEGGEAIPLRDKFPANTPDIDWIESIGNEGG